jgi:hydrogenase nickel incorporation protein HypB
MCGICGCGEGDTIHDSLNHTHEDEHSHSHLVQIEQDIFAKNNRFAQANRNYFLSRQVLALNLMSSPGSGKTTLLVKTISDLKHRFNIATIEGDQQTRLDAERIEAAGASAIQINTGKSCHLDAHQVGHAAEKLVMNDKTLLFIENVGNLVCPSLFDLGETFKVAILSVTEGEDKPLKYPDMFRAADVMLLNKFDLLPYVDFNVQQCIEYARRINPEIQVLELSAKTGSGMNDWYQWLELNYSSLKKINV